MEAFLQQHLALLSPSKTSGSAVVTPPAGNEHPDDARPSSTPATKGPTPALRHHQQPHQQHHNYAHGPSGQGGEELKEEPGFGPQEGLRPDARTPRPSPAARSPLPPSTERVDNDNDSLSSNTEGAEGTEAITPSSWSACSLTMLPGEGTVHEERQEEIEGKVPKPTALELCESEAKVKAGPMYSPSEGLPVRPRVSVDETSLHSDLDTSDDLGRTRLRTDCWELERERNEKKRELIEVKQSLQEHESRIRATRATACAYFQGLKEDLSQLQRDIEDCQKQRQSQLDETEREQQAFDVQRREGLNQLSSLRKQREQQKREIQTESKELDVLMLRRLQVETEHDNLIRQKELLESRVGDLHQLQKEKHLLQKELAAMRATRQDLQHDVSTTDTYLNGKKALLERLQEESESVTIRATEEKRRLHSLQLAIAEALSTLRLIQIQQSEAEASNAALETVRAHLSEAQAELLDTREKIHFSRISLAQLEKTNHLLHEGNLRARAEQSLRGGRTGTDPLLMIPSDQANVAAQLEQLRSQTDSVLSSLARG